MEGISFCSDCPLGKFSEHENSTTCSACRPGTFADQTSAATCASCSKGKYNNETGSTACSFCPEGKFAASEGMLQCTFCAAGSWIYQEGINDSPALCRNCSRGQQGEYGFACSDCPPGTYAPVEGLGACWLCPRGKHSPNGMTHCLECTADTYADQEGTEGWFCPQCPYGKFSEAGATSCS